ncbi:hypothetical protein QUC31_007086 [Theobroma cacao]|uniref:Uncharacterized protein LOC18604036 n=2 Tax=Theobroma cacao TaxID=3641 RepID=A0AB32VAE7_THECC|nr:PREDICTED: uncharacterized protein LOC18604036 [Theobroma cacao]EOY20891.1 Mediator of RNA polymerase II transcription subunit 13, putative [Theobroma cacao]
MKKKLEVEDDGVKDLEIIKAVAQAWHSQSGCTRPTNEFDAYRRNFRGQPSRFKLEAMSRPSSVKDNVATPCWDFGQSLWDSYEIVTVAKKLETGLVFDDPLTGLEEDMSRAQRKHKEGKNSLRNLLKRVTSRRFNEADIPRENRNGF